MIRVEAQPIIDRRALFCWRVDYLHGGDGRREPRSWKGEGSAVVALAKEVLVWLVKNTVGANAAVFARWVAAVVPLAPRVTVATVPVESTPVTAITSLSI